MSKSRVYRLGLKSRLVRVGLCGVCCRPSDHREEVGEAFYRQLEAATKSQALALVGYFNHPDISWRNNMARHKQSRRFLEIVGHNFLTQVVEEKTSNGELFDYVLPNREGFVAYMRAGGILGYSRHEIRYLAWGRKASK